MEDDRKTHSPLGPYVVLDLTDEKGAFCTKLLADLGAEVIKIEPPGGHSTRDLGPFYQDIHSPEKSLFWFYFNTSKKSVTLDITTAEGQDTFKKLAKISHFVVESFQPGYLDSLGLGYSALREVNPSIIMTSITGFGQTGPYKDYKVSDIVGLAMGGWMHVNGDPDRSPLVLGAWGAYGHAGVQAAIATLIAHLYRAKTGKGQYIDVSMQGAVTIGIPQHLAHWEFEKIIKKRSSTTREWAGLHEQYLHPCKDGYVVCRTGFGGGAGKALVEWMHSEGMAGELDASEMQKLGQMVSVDGSITQEDVERRERIVVEFFMKHTARELFEKGQKMGLQIMPFNRIEQLLDDPQLNARGF